MTLSEFKAWFEGFTDGMEADFYHNYWPRRSYEPYWGWYSAQGVGLNASTTQMYAANAGQASGVNNMAWDSSAAMTALGRADAIEEAA